MPIGRWRTRWVFTAAQTVDWGFSPIAALAVRRPSRHNFSRDCIAHRFPLPETPRRVPGRVGHIADAAAHRPQ
jgi:hypothetical protein